MSVSVSFVIPIFNQSSNLLNKSLNALEYIDKKIKWEAIVIDDGSAKNYRQAYKKIIKKENSKVKYFYKKNEGVSSARNFGIKCAQYEYVIFVDVDDIELASKISLDDFNQKSDLIIYNVKMKYLSCGKSQLYSLVEDKDDVSRKDLLPYLLEDGLLNWVFGKCYRRKFLKKYNIMFNQDIKTGEDFDFNNRILNKYPKIKYISRTSYIYNYDENSDFIRKRKFPKTSLYDAEHVYQLRKGILNELDKNNEEVEAKLKNKLMDAIFYCYAGSILNNHKNIYKESLSVINEHIDENKLSLGSKVKLRILKRSNSYELKCFLLVKKIYRKIKPYQFS